MFSRVVLPLESYDHQASFKGANDEGRYLGGNGVCTNLASPLALFDNAIRNYERRHTSPKSERLRGPKVGGQALAGDRSTRSPRWPGAVCRMVRTIPPFCSWCSRRRAHTQVC